MMRRWCFYDLKTGEFTGRETCASDDRDISRNTPEGCGAIEGRYDRLAQRVDVQTGKVVEWVNTARIEEISKRERVNGAKARILELEGKLLRPMLEDKLQPAERGDDGKLPSERLREISDEIVALRAVISDGTDTTSPSRKDP